MYPQPRRSGLGTQAMRAVLRFSCTVFRYSPFPQPPITFCVLASFITEMRLGYSSYTRPWR